MWFSSKFERPALPAKPIARPRLYARLQGWQERRAVFIHAPAGYGKTALVRLWLDTLDAAVQVAWLALEKDDHDPIQFLASLAGALLQPLPGAVARVRPWLEAEPPEPRRALRSLLTALQPGGETPAPTAPLLMVMDDYHRAAGAELDGLIELILEHAPVHVHLVLLSRHATAAPLARWYAAGQVLELTPADLQFRREELRQYLRGFGVPALSQQDLDLLLEKTEGWIAALQLAGITLSKHGDIHDAISRLRGNRGWLAEYLTGEVLAQQPPDVRRFLLETSLLDPFNAPLCEAVCGLEDAYQLLSAVAAADLFLVPLGGNGDWFRYHHLFQELLQHRLREALDKPAIAALHRRAASWLAGMGDVAGAIGHWLAASDELAAAMVVEEHARPAMLRGATHQAQQWLDLLPPALRDQRPRLLLDQCLLCILRDQAVITTTTARAAAAIDRLPATAAARPVLAAELLVYRTLGYYLMLDFAGAAACASQAQQAWAWLDDLGRGMLDFVLLHLAWRAGQGETALQHGEQAIAELHRAGFDQGVISVRREQALIAMQAGRSAEALHQFEQTFVACDPARTFLLREVFLSYHRAVYLCYWLDRLDQASAYQRAALVLAERLADPDLLATAQLLGFLVDVARPGHSVAAASSADALVSDARAASQRVAELQIRLLILRGDAEQAWVRASKLGIQLDSNVSHHSETRVSVFLYAYVARGVELAAVTPLLDAAREHFAASGNLFHAISVDALAAWRHLQLGNLGAATTELSATLDLVEQTGYVRLILDLPALAPLLTMIEHPTAVKLMDRLETGQPARQKTELTPQEAAILELLTRDLRYREIADELMISVNTVRTHVRSIYRKLGVTRRLSAVERIREAESPP